MLKIVNENKRGIRMTIEELDEFCRLRNKSIVVQRGALAGFMSSEFMATNLDKFVKGGGYSVEY